MRTKNISIFTTILFACVAAVWATDTRFETKEDSQIKQEHNREDVKAIRDDIQLLRTEINNQLENIRTDQMRLLLVVKRNKKDS